MSKPLDPAKMRKWANTVQTRLREHDAALVRHNNMDLPFGVRPRTEGPLTAAQLADKMVRNGVDRATAERNAARIVG